MCWIAGNGASMIMRSFRTRAAAPEAWQLGAGSHLRGSKPAASPCSRLFPPRFDIPPIGGAPPPLTQLPGAVQVFSVPQSMAPTAGSGPVISGASAMSQQATRHARRIYVGGLPPSANEQNVQVQAELLCSGSAWVYCGL